ncbi:MAG: PAS domain-containing protein [Pseudomonadota bacterium]
MSDTPFYSSNDTAPGGLIRRLRSKATPSGVDSRNLLSYWNATRSGMDVPFRSEIDPRGIAGMLSRTFIIEQIAPGIGRFRVAGTHLGDLLGMDVRGMPMSAMLHPSARDDLSDGLRNLFEMPGILRAALVSPGEFRRPELEAELLILPLRDDRGEVTRAIGCLIANGQVGKTPRRFNIRHMRVDPVSVVRPAEDIERLAPAVIADQINTGIRQSVQQGFAEDGPRFAPPKPGQPSYLRLVVSDS